MKKGIIFDLDGTLWDATENLVAPWNTALGRHKDINVTLTHKDLMGFMGKTVEEISLIIIPHIPYDRRIAIMTEGALEGNEYLRTHGGILYPDLVKTLLKLKKDYHISIVSNCLKGYIEAFTSYHNLEGIFDDTLCQGDTGKTKGENIKLMVERNNLDSAIYVGDTQSDYDASHFADIPFIHASYGFGTVKEDVPKLDKISDLCEKVKEII